MNELAIRNENASGLMRYVAENDQVAIAGDLLLFKKGLWYRSGAEFTPGPRQFLANPGETYTGWTKWDDGKPTDHRLSRIADYAGGISRRELGDMDKNAWPTNDHGAPIDPWQPSDRMLLRTTDSAEDLLTFVSGSRGGRNAIASLIGKVARSIHFTDDGKFPVITLHASSYEHDDYGLVHVPEFRIVDWEFWERDRNAAPKGSTKKIVAADTFSEKLDDENSVLGPTSGALATAACACARR